MKDTRVALILRGKYVEATCIASAAAFSNHIEFEAVLPTPAILNEVRVRAVADGPSSRVVAAFTVWGAAHPDGDPTTTLDSPYTKTEVQDADGSRSLVYGAPWSLLVEAKRYSGHDLEVRHFALCNVPRVPPCSATLKAALLAAPTLSTTLWAAALADGCSSPLTVSLARALLEARSKLKSFLSADGTADDAAHDVEAAAAFAAATSGPISADAWFRGASWLTARASDAAPRLKAWPSKGGVQQLVVLWMCLALVAGHEYTAPELYAHISDLCACQPDHGVVRKEMVRNGFLDQPVITTNPDKTTTTTYRLAPAAMETALRSDILGALVKVKVPPPAAKKAPHPAAKK